MGALNALRRSPGTLIENPVVVIPVIVIGLFQLPQMLAQAVDPLLASVASLAFTGLFVFVMPFFQAGIIGMADEALDGGTRLRTFVADGKAHYIPVFIAYLLLTVLNIVIGGIIMVVAFVGGLVVLPNVELSGFALGVIGLFFVLMILAFLLFVFFIQFYAQAIVLDNEGPIGGIKRSFGLVRRNLLSTLGYSVIGGFVGGFIGLLIGGVSMLITPEAVQAFQLPQLSWQIITVLSFVVVIVGSIVGSFMAIFSVAYYRDIRGAPDVH